MADPSTAPPLIPSSITTAHTKIEAYIHLTPLITSKTMNEIASHAHPQSFTALPNTPPPSTKPPAFNLHFKCENQQKIGAFKARGAHHALLRLIDTHGLEAIRSRGVITHSSGNHAQALALAASTFNVPSHVVMPTISTASKIAGTRAYTDNVYFSGSTAEERETEVSRVQGETGAVLVPPYDHPDIILGQGTVAREMEMQLGHGARFDAVVAPLGGGGLLGGVATWFAREGKRTLVFGAEPEFEGANDAQRGLAREPPERIEHVKTLTIADGLRTPVGVLNWEIVKDKEKVKGVYSVTEEQIMAAMQLLIERVKVVVEPSACVPVAVVLFNEEFRELVAKLQAEEGTGRPWEVGIVLSGGNTTVEAVAKLFGGEQDEKSAQRETGEVGMDGKRNAEDVAG